MGPGVGPEGWLKWSAHLFGGGVCNGHGQHPAFAPSSSEVAAEILVFLYLTVHNLPQLRMHSSLVPCSFFLIPYSTGKPGTLWSMVLQRS